MATLDEYLWCVVLGGLFCFTLGFGMGANDVSNNFGTSIGAKSISLKSAIVIAAIFEFIGSVALGATVTDAVRKGVYDPDEFGDRYDLLLIANLVALIVGTTWLLSASRVGLPVSTTHSLIGALLGCGLGISAQAVQWPFVALVVASWFMSPLLSGLIGILYYWSIRQWVLRKPNSVKRGMNIAWFLVWLTITVCSVFFMWSNPVIMSGVACEQRIDGKIQSVRPCQVSRWVVVNPGWALLIALGIGTGLTLLVCPLVYWRARKMLQAYDLRLEAMEGAAADLELVANNDTRSTSTRSATSIQIDTPAAAKRSSTSPTVASLDVDEEAVRGCKGKVGEIRKNMPWNQDLHQAAFDGDSKVSAMERRAEKFDPRCETFFKTLQIVSASLGCLLHGSNDVSNAAAPYASVYDIYRAGLFRDTIQVPIWILILGGSAISVGLTFLGHKVIRRVGIELLYVSPSRGFCIELASSTIMLVASFSGLPLSTTHVLVGAMLGVGLIDKRMDLPEDEEAPSALPLSERVWCGLNFSAINWRVARQIATAWVGTLVVCALMSYCLFSFVIHSPSLNLPMVQETSGTIWDNNASW